RPAFSRGARRGDSGQRVAAGAAFSGPICESSAGKLLHLGRKLRRDRIARFDRTRDAVEPGIGLGSTGVLRERARAADPATLGGGGGAHREAVLPWRGLRRAVEATVGGEVGRDRDISFLRAGQPRVLLDQ